MTLVITMTIMMITDAINLVAMKSYIDPKIRPSILGGHRLTDFVVPLCFVPMHQLTNHSQYE